MLALTDSGLGYIAIANLGGPAAAGPCVESTCRDIVTARFCCAVRATGSLKSSARTVAPTRAPAMRVPYPWIEVALCGLPPAVVGAPKGASHAETSAAARVVRGRRETSKILANGGVCAGAFIAGPIGTGARSARVLPATLSARR